MRLLVHNTIHNPTEKATQLHIQSKYKITKIKNEQNENEKAPKHSSAREGAPRFFLLHDHSLHSLCIVGGVGCLTVRLRVSEFGVLIT